MKKLLALALALCMVLSLCACGAKEESAPAAEAPAAAAPAAAAPAPADEPVNISLWMYPVGGLGDSAVIDPIIADFEAANPGIKVAVEYLDYTNGDDQVNTAIEGGNAPDVIMEGPERLVANWGAKGYMYDMSELLDDGDKTEINPALLAAGTSKDGKLYDYPMVSVTHCMVINYDAFVAAGADQYVDLTTRRWTTEQFQEAVKALYAFYGENVLSVYCGGQGGDQGTRALITNLYGGTFTNADHTGYTANSPENTKALELLYNLDGVYFDPAIVAGDEINLVRQGILKIGLCWNAAQQTTGDMTDTGEKLEYMCFPTDGGADPILQGGIWGLGMFDTGDEARIEAAKTLVKYLCDGEGTPAAVLASTFLPARTAVDGKDFSSDLFAGNDMMINYIATIAPFLGDYYQITENWAAARTAWWNMLQRVGAGDGSNIAAELDAFVAEANP